MTSPWAINAWAMTHFQVITSFFKREVPRKFVQSSSWWQNVSVVRILRSWQVRSALSLKVPNLHLAFWSLDAYFDGSIPLGSIFFSMSRTRNDWLGASSSSWFQWKFTYAQNIRFDVIKNNQSHLQRSMYRYVGGDYLISLSYRKILIYYEVWIEVVG